MVQNKRQRSPLLHGSGAGSWPSRTSRWNTPPIERRETPQVAAWVAALAKARGRAAACGAALRPREVLQEQKAKPAELGPLRLPWVAATLVTTGKGGKEQKGQHRGKGETRQRSAAAVERRILRGAARRAEAWLRSEEGEEAGQCKRPRREELDYVEALRLQSVPESAVPEFLDERNTVQEGLPTWGSTHGASQRVWGRFQREFPQLSQVVSSTPGRTARRPCGGRPTSSTCTTRCSNRSWWRSGRRRRGKNPLRWRRRDGRRRGGRDSLRRQRDPLPRGVPDDPAGRGLRDRVGDSRKQFSSGVRSRTSCSRPRPPKREGQGGSERERRGTGAKLQEQLEQSPKFKQCKLVAKLWFAKQLDERQRGLGWRVVPWQQRVSPRVARRPLVRRVTPLETS